VFQFQDKTPASQLLKNKIKTWSPSQIYSPFAFLKKIKKIPCLDSFRNQFVILRVLEISFLAPQCRETQDLVLSATLNGEEINSSSLHLIGEIKKQFFPSSKTKKRKENNIKAPF
jgi:hypothetical protein